MLSGGEYMACAVDPVFHALPAQNWTNAHVSLPGLGQSKHGSTHHRGMQNKTEQLQLLALEMGNPYTNWNYLN